MNGSKVDLILKELMERYPVLMPVKEDIFKTYEILRDAFLQDGTLLIAGNGGSCATEPGYSALWTTTSSRGPGARRSWAGR